MKIKKGQGDFILVILAAGKGKRMRSEFPKVLLQLGSKPLIEWVLEATKPLKFKEKVIIVGYKGDMIKKFKDLTFIEQKHQLGTAHALLQAESLLRDRGGDLLVLPGDTIVETKALKDLIDFHSHHKGPISILTAEIKEPRGYGRIIRDEKGMIIKIIEEAEAQSLEVKEINTGVYCFRNDQALWDTLKTIKIKYGEYYLTDVVEAYVRREETVRGLKTTGVRGINTRADLAKAFSDICSQVINELMESGITILDPQTTYIEKGVKVGIDTTIYPFTFIFGNTRIGKRCLIGPSSLVRDSVIEDEVTVEHSVVKGARVRRGCLIGPFSHLRPGADIGPKVRVGSFVEVKNSRIEEGSVAAHLAYIGDSHIGKEVNIGAGMITCNFDGVRKHKTEIGDGSFIGSNVSLVAPIKLGENVTVGAGSVLTKDVPDGTLAIARSRQVNIENWKGKNKKGR